MANIYNDSSVNTQQLQGVVVSSISPSNGQALVYKSANNDYKPNSIAVVGGSPNFASVNITPLTVSETVVTDYPKI
jgi:hypothetical protein